MLRWPLCTFSLRVLRVHRCIFFFNDTATTEIYTLSLHDALPIWVPGQTSSLEGTRIYPGNPGATSWYSPSYSPRTGLFYVSAWANSSSIFVKVPVEYKEGREYAAGTATSSIPFDWSPAPNFRKQEEGYGAVRALNPQTGERKWEFKMADVTESGILTTTSDLL